MPAAPRKQLPPAKSVAKVSKDAAASTEKRKSRNPNGRPAGVPNKVNKEVRDQILGALEELGGQAYMVKVGKKNPALFFSVLGRCIPAHIKADVNVNSDLAARLLEAEQAIRAANKE